MGPPGTDLLAEDTIVLAEEETSGEILLRDGALVHDLNERGSVRTSNVGMDEKEAPVQSDVRYRTGRCS